MLPGSVNSIDTCRRGRAISMATMLLMRARSAEACPSQLLKHLHRKIAQRRAPHQPFVIAQPCVADDVDVVLLVELPHHLAVGRAAVLGADGPVEILVLVDHVAEGLPVGLAFDRLHLLAEGTDARAREAEDADIGEGAGLLARDGESLRRAARL